MTKDEALQIKELVKKVNQGNMEVYYALASAFDLRQKSNDDTRIAELESREKILVEALEDAPCECRCSKHNNSGWPQKPRHLKVCNDRYVEMRTTFDSEHVKWDDCVLKQCKRCVALKVVQ